MCWDPDARERWLQAQREAQEIQAGDFICPWCQRYVDPAEWWTHIDARPYEDIGTSENSFAPTLFHRRCAAGVPEKNVAWVKALRRTFTNARIKPGDYVRLKRRIGKAKAGALCRVVDLETDEYIGVTEDDPYYIIDLGEPGQEYEEMGSVRRDEIEPVDRPYLK